MITRYRWHTELNTGLRADLFEVPEEVSWEPELARTSVFEHAPVPPGGPAALRLRVEDLDPGINPETGDPWLSPLSRYLIETYLREKLQVAGVLAATDPPEWRLIWRVEENKLTLKIAVYVQSLVDDGLWGGMVRYRPPSGHGIDDLAADSVTWEVILRMSAGIMELVEARTAAAQQALPPAAGNNPDSD